MSKALEEKIDFGTAKQMVGETQEDFDRAEGTQLRRLNIACGQRLEEGWEGIDLHTKGDNITNYDLFLFPWPYVDNTFYEISCSHFVEHIPHDLHNGSLDDGLFQFMEEVYRIIQPQGTIRIQAPYYTSIRAHQDPSHNRYICERTFSYFNKDSNNAMGIDHYTPKVNFEVLSVKYILEEEYQNRSEEARIWAMKHYWNVVKDIDVVLRAIK